MKSPEQTFRELWGPYNSDKAMPEFHLIRNWFIKGSEATMSPPKMSTPLAELLDLIEAPMEGTTGWIDRRTALRGAAAKIRTSFELGQSVLDDALKMARLETMAECAEHGCMWCRERLKNDVLGPK